MVRIATSLSKRVFSSRFVLAWKELQLPDTLFRCGDRRQTRILKGSFIRASILLAMVGIPRTTLWAPWNVKLVTSEWYLKNFTTNTTERHSLCVVKTLIFRILSLRQVVSPVLTPVLKLLREYIRIWLPQSSVLSDYRVLPFGVTNTDGQIRASFNDKTRQYNFLFGAVSFWLILF